MCALSVRKHTARNTTKAAWEMTEMFHLEAIRLISKNLRGAVENTKEGREGMALGQYIAAMGVEGVDSMSQDEYRDAAINAVKKLSEDVGIPKTLDQIKEEDLD